MVKTHNSPLKRFMSEQWAAALIGNILLFLILAVSQPAFLQATNIMNILCQCSLFGIMAIGMTFVISTGGIDISVGMNALFTMALMYRLNSYGIFPVWAIFLIVLVVGCLVGLLNGFMASVLNFPDMIATLATMSILRGAAYLLLDNSQKFVDAPLRVIGNSKLFQLVPTPTVLMVIMTVIGILVLRYSRFGRYVLAVGGSKNSAVFSGLNVTRIRIGAYVICGVCAALGGIVYAGRIGSIAPQLLHGLRVHRHHRRRSGRHQDERRQILHCGVRARMRFPLPDRKRHDDAGHLQLLPGLRARGDDALRHRDRHRHHDAQQRERHQGTARALPADPIGLVPGTACRAENNKSLGGQEMRKALALVLALAMTLALAACGSSAPEAPANTPAPESAAPSAADDAAPAPSEDAGKTIKIGVSTDTATTVFRKVELMGLYSAAEAAGNVEIIELCADDDTTTQYTQFKSLIDQGVDVIVCCAIDQDAILTAYDYAQAAGVPVINYDRKVEHENVFFTAMYDSYSDAKQLAEYLLSVDDGEEHTIFLTVGSLADPNGIARREGFQETIAASGHTNLKVVEIMTDWDVDKALTNMQNALQVYTPWAVANVSAHMDGSCYQALEEAGLKIKRGEEGHVYYTSLSGEPPAVAYMEEGYTDKIFVIPADTAGGAIYDAAVKLVNGETLESDTFYMPTFGVGPDELEAKSDEIWTVKYADMLG